MAEMVLRHHLGGKSGQQSVGCPDVKQFMTGDCLSEEIYSDETVRAAVTMLLSQDNRVKRR